MMALQHSAYTRSIADKSLPAHHRQLAWQRPAANHAESQPHALAGKVTEVVVQDDAPQTMAMLLPLLAQLSFDQRWFLWLAPPQTLAKPLLAQAGFDLKKVMLLNPDPQNSTFQLACKGLKTGTSHIALCIDRPFTENEMKQLKDAARLGQSHVIVIRYC